MDNLRGQFTDHGELQAVWPEDDHSDDEIGHEPPPAAIGQDERRMQVRAYNFWASLLDDRCFPAIDRLKPELLEDFGPFSVLLDFSDGMDNPAIAYVGAKLAAECDTDTSLKFLADVPSRSLLSRITDHYMQILANEAPIGFEAEFVNQRGLTILYRGILLPFSSDGAAIDFIYGVINWKELADQQTTDELLLQIDQALAPMQRHGRESVPLTEWADGPVDHALPEPAFGAPAEVGTDYDGVTAPISEAAAARMDLADWLASARDLAQIASGSEDRSRQALYAAIGRAYDFSIAAASSPRELAEMVEEAGLTVQERAPMTPLVKLVFGADYDKTRITEYATALGHARRIGLRRGELAGYLADAPGGLKGVVAEERRLRRAEAGQPRASRRGLSEAVVSRLRGIEPVALADMTDGDSEFGLVMTRRLASGEVIMLGEVGKDAALLQRAARTLLA